MYEFCISQGTMATFFRCGGQVQKHLSRISSGFCVPKIIQIGLFLMELFKKIWPLFWVHTVCVQCIIARANDTDQNLHICSVWNLQVRKNLLSFQYSIVFFRIRSVDCFGVVFFQQSLRASWTLKVRLQTGCYMWRPNRGFMVIG